ncbi:alpha/beta hydrolase [Arenibaculum sp.]|uniref:alpha/beta hydrolase n=1 Tax=Arenibaculum sp. TaxID=2865862 RepID=UPI002E10C5AC|nr:alpha/beta fold hydrolase [Arenibaculum sp.]
MPHQSDHAPDLWGPSLAPASGGPARQLVVLLHGVGADGGDLIQLGAELRPFLPHAAFLAPDAPEPCDMAPYGRQWFSLRDRRDEAMTAGAERTVPQVDAWIDRQLAERGLPASALALVGFSQGTMMALNMALRRPEPVAAVVGFSGLLLDPGGLAARIRSRPPVLLIHGELDDIVPFGCLAAAGDALRAGGVPVETVARPGLAHGIDPEGLMRAARFLADRLGA